MKCGLVSTGVVDTIQPKIVSSTFRRSTNYFRLAYTFDHRSGPPFRRLLLGKSSYRRVNGKKSLQFTVGKNGFEHNNLAIFELKLH